MRVLSIRQTDEMVSKLRVLIAATHCSLALILILTAACRAPRGSVPAGWTPSEDRLPDGVRVFSFADPVLPLRATCVLVDLERSGLELRVFLEDVGETVTRIANRERTLVATNGGYFGGGRSLSLAIDRGRVLSKSPDSLTRDGRGFACARGAFGVMGDGTFDVAWVDSSRGTTRALDEPLPHAIGNPASLAGDAGRNWDAYTAIGAGPVLVQAGAPRVTWHEEVFFGSGIGRPDQPQPRTAIGYTESGTLIWMVVEGRSAESRGLTLDELAQLFVEFGATEALNLDGGGSSVLAIHGERRTALPDGASERPVQTVLALLPASADPP